MCFAACPLFDSRFFPNRCLILFSAAFSHSDRFSKPFHLYGIFYFIDYSSIIHPYGIDGIMTCTIFDTITLNCIQT